MIILDSAVRPRPADLSSRTAAGAHAVLAGGRARLVPFLGPAVITSVAYVDPGNIVTNTAAGAAYGYGLAWVVVAASAIAMLFQALSARLGIVTGRNLPELCRDFFPRPVAWGMWIGGEVAAMATDLAEFLGAAIGLSLLLGCSLVVGMVLAAIVTFALLTLQRAGFRPLELVIGGMVMLIGACYLVELTIAPVRWGELLRHSVRPALPDRQALLLAAGILGATVMPHALYLHSGLVQARIPTRTAAERRRLIVWSDREVALALGGAGLINIAMLALSAAAFHDGSNNGIAGIKAAWRALGVLLGDAAAGAFLLALVASGLSSSVVGTMAGQVIMQGFIRRVIPLMVRRLLTMSPAFVAVLMGVDVDHGLIWSQVVLSLVLPAPMIAMLVLVRRPAVMGEHALRPVAWFVAAAACAVILGMNLVLLLTL